MYESVPALCLPARDVTQEVTLNTSDSTLSPAKTCTKCGEEKPRAEFARHPRGQNGLRAQCKACSATADRLRRAANLERERKRNVAYYASHREKKAAYYVSHREDRRVYEATHHKQQLGHRAAWYAANPEKARASNVTYRAAHPEATRAWSRRYRARKLAASGTHTAADVIQLFDAQDGLCAYCGCELGADYHVDHKLPLIRGGSDDPENLAIT